MFLLMLPTVMAAHQTTIVYELQDDQSIKTIISLEFDDNITRDVLLQVPTQHENLRVAKDKKLASYNIENSQLTVSLEDNQELLIVYYTDFYTLNNEFVNSIKPIIGDGSLQVLFVMPTGYRLATSITSDELTNTVSPKPNNILSDGQQIILEWTRQNFDGEFALFVRYKKPVSQTIPIIILMIVILLLSAYSIYNFFREPQIKTITKDYDISDHLKEDEQIIINLLKNRGGECEQATLTLISDFSKAKISRLLFELEERKVIKKVKKGKKNYIMLKKER